MRLRKGLVVQFEDHSTLLVKDLRGRGALTVDLYWPEDNSRGSMSAASFLRLVKRNGGIEVRGCRECGCTDLNCTGCIARTGVACHWVAPDLCSACGGHEHGRAPEYLTDNDLPF